MDERQIALQNLYMSSIKYSNENIIKNIKYEREIALQQLLNMCSIKYSNENIKNINYYPCDNDRANENENQKFYSVCYNKHNKNLKKYCGPDFFFYNWPSANINSFEETKNQIILESRKKPTIDKVGWYGNIYSPLNNVIEYHTRPLLKKIGDENCELYDIKHVLPQNNVLNNNNLNYISLPELIKYKYLIDIGGNGWSGRLKWLLFSKRPLLLVDRNYIDYFYEDLIPYTHYIPVNMDLSNLLEQTNWMINNYEKSLQIANNAFEFAINNFTTDKILEKIYEVYNTINN